MDTLAILTQKYQEYNGLYFDGKLPMIPIRWGKLKYATAHVGFQTVGIKGGAKRFHGGLHMVFSDKYDRPADTLFPVLLHEMIHVYLVAVLDDIVDNHGPVFLRLRKELSAKSGIDIPLKDQAEEFELKTPIKPLYIVLKYYRNTVGYAIISKTTIDAKKDFFQTIFMRDAVDIRLVESEVWTRKAESTRVQRNLSYKTGFFIAKEDDLTDLYDHSKLIWTNRINKDITESIGERPISESVDETEIHDYANLDRILLKLCHMIMTRHKADPKKNGLVGAALIDTDGRITLGQSTGVGEKWIHAERQAMTKYRDKHGEIPEGSIIVTTLSPCNQAMGDRKGNSCTDLINESSISKVYCGYIDPTQTGEDRTFNLMETADPKIRKLCEKISDIFLEHKRDFIKK